MKKNVLQCLFLAYLKLLKRTVKIKWQAREIALGGQIFGFWHGDSLSMNLLLEDIYKTAGEVNVIVTKDRRGDYIEEMLESCRGKAIRVSDGKASFHKLREIEREFKERNESLAVALDGPLGPRHVPKKLAFYLSEKTGKRFTAITLSYSGCIHLKRWDAYAVPLPFSTVYAAAHDYGMTKKNKIPNLSLEAGCAIMEQGKTDRKLPAGGLYGNKSYFSCGR